MHIRNATIEDIEKLVSVEQLCFPINEAATYEDIKARVEVYPNHFWLLFDKEEIVGFVNGMTTSIKDLQDEMYENASLHDEDGDWQMIFGVNTIPTYRRQGCAKKILDRVIMDARKQGRKGLVLTCKEELLPYYAKFGFVSEGVSQSVHGNVIWYQMRFVF